MSVSAHPTPQPGTEEYHPVFVGKTLEQLGEILKRYPTKQAAWGSTSCRCAPRRRAMSAGPRPS